MIKEGMLIGGRYEIQGRIGTGGMADVYKAVDKVLNRYVAVKVLKREFREDENFVNKFRSEAQAAAGLQHPNIVNVYDVAEDRGLYYIVMELVEGITLKDYIQKKGRLTPKEVIGITIQVCSGIDTAHSNNIVHRDIKPQNIMISKEGKVKVTDFGIAKATSSNTISTNAMGSVHYTSPEQARGGFSDVKSDIYSLGISMYEMITGEVPFDGDSTVSIALKHLQEDIVPPSEIVPDIPYSLEQIILKCTQKSADRRYTNVMQLVRDLKRSIQEPDGNFVRIAPLKTGTKTITVTPEELEAIQRGAQYNPNYEDDYDEDYDDYDDDDYDRDRRRNSKDKSDIDPKMTKAVKILAIVAAVIAIGVLAWIIISLLGVGKENVTGGDKGGVPNVIGMTWDEAEKACAEVGIFLDKRGEEESEEYDKGYIFKQIPAEGATITEGTKLQVYVSTGLKEQMIEIPDVTDMTENEAIIELVKAGFKKKNMEVKEENHATIQEGNVTRTDPAIGETIGEKSEIVIYISTGKTSVPNIVGKTKDEAEKLLTAAGLKGVGTEDKSSELPQYQVASQVIAENTVVDQGTEVEYVYSAGAKLVTIPNELIGKHYYDVIVELEKLGFGKIETDGTMSSKYNREMVVSIENGSGEKITGKKITLDTTITIIVSDGPGPNGGDTDDGGAQEPGTELQAE